MSKKKKVFKIKSTAPAYCLAFLWLFWGIAFDFYKPIHYIACALVSILVFSLAKAIWPSKKVTLADEEQKNETPKNQATSVNSQALFTPKKVSTGDEELDKMIDDKDKAIAEMHRLNDAINDRKLSDQIDHLEIVTTKIVKYVMEHPEKKKQVRRFFNYYLPTTLKLLNAYDRMDDAGVSGMNIDGTMGKVETMMDTAVAAFDKQLDALFADEALDISTDISVMENLLKAEGLVDNPEIEEAMAAASAFNPEITIDDVLKTDEVSETVN